MAEKIMLFNIFTISEEYLNSVKKNEVYDEIDLESYANALLRMRRICLNVSEKEDQEQI